MVQFRKSKKIGPFRLTASKSGISVSGGAGPIRVSRGADGKVRRTITAPGTGLSDTRVIGGNSRGSSAPAPRNAPPNPAPASTPAQPQPPGIAGYQGQMASTFRCGVVQMAPITAKGYNGTVTFTGSEVHIERGGLSAKMGGLSSLTIPITSVNEVVWREPSMMVNGHLRFVVPTVEGILPSEVPIPQDDYAILVTKQSRKRFDEILAALNVAMTHPSSP